MTDNQIMMTCDLINAECDLDNPTFEWNGESFPCIPGTDTQMLKVNTGLEVVKTLSMTIRLFDADGGWVFPNNIIPESQQDSIVYQGELYAVEEVTQNVLRASFNMLCVSPTRDN